MKNFCEGFCKTTGVIVGFFATIVAMGAFIDNAKREAFEEFKAKTEE